MKTAVIAVYPVGVQWIDRELAIADGYIGADICPMLAGIAAAEQPDETVGRSIEGVGVSGLHQ